MRIRNVPNRHTDGKSGNPALQKVLKRLEGVKASGAGWVALCPAHADHDPSLSIGLGQRGQVLLKCHAGCDTEEVLAELDLEWRDLFPARHGRKEGGTYQSL